MHRLQELVRLHRLGEGARDVARKLQMSPNTEREYRKALENAGVLRGDANELPELVELRGIVEAAKPVVTMSQQRSSIEQRRQQIETLMGAGAGPTAIFDRLRVEHDDFTGTVYS